MARQEITEYSSKLNIVCCSMRLALHQDGQCDQMVHFHSQRLSDTHPHICTLSHMCIARAQLHHGNHITLYIIIKAEANQTKTGWIQ